MARVSPGSAARCQGFSNVRGKGIADIPRSGPFGAGAV